MTPDGDNNIGEATPVTPQAEHEAQEGMQALAQSLRVSLVWLYAFVILMAAVVIGQAFFVVKQHEVGFVYRFGRLRAVVGTGLHLVWPYPVEETEVHALSRSKQLESRSFMHQPLKKGATVPPSLKPGVDGFLLAGDRSIIHAATTLTYVVDARNRNAVLDHLVFCADNEALLTALLDNAVLKATASMPADTILLDPDAFQARVASAFRRNVERGRTGISFEARDLAVAPVPPRQARAAFDALNQAHQRRDRVVNDAIAYKIKTETAAESEKDAVVAAAEGDRLARVAEAEAAAATFKDRLAQFERDPELVTRTVYQETLARILQNVDEKFIVPERSGRKVRVMLSRQLGGKQTEGGAHE